MKDKETTMMEEEWRIEKKGMAFLLFILAFISGWFVPVIFAPSMETLLNVGEQALVYYTFVFALSYIMFLEVFGGLESRGPNFGTLNPTPFLFSGLLASVSLLLFVWIFEYQFIGRLVVLNLTLFTPITSLLAIFILRIFIKNKPRRVLLFIPRSVEDLFKKEIKFSIEECIWINRSLIEKNVSIVDFCKQNNVDILVADQECPFNEQELVQVLSAGTKVMSMAQFCEFNYKKVPSKYVSFDWLYRLELRLRNPFSNRFKRIMDFFLSFIGLLLCLPILLLTALAILTESGFPIFFKQKRVGLHGRPYILYKLRSMQNDAELNGAKWAGEADQRITKVGKLIRNLRIDEIPQFWNILKGEMSIVGPRPERPEFHIQLQESIPYWSTRTLIKPGLTGWAQIRYRYASDKESSEEKLSYDLYYLKNANFFFDIEIILSTLRSITQGSR